MYHNSIMPVNNIFTPFGSTNLLELSFSPMIGTIENRIKLKSLYWFTLSQIIKPRS